MWLGRAPLPDTYEKWWRRSKELLNLTLQRVDKMRVRRWLGPRAGSRDEQVVGQHDPKAVLYGTHLVVTVGVERHQD